MSFWKRKKLLKAGDVAPDFRLATPAGESKTLEAILASGPALLAFFRADCPVCQFTFPFLDRLYKAAGNSAIQFFGISQDDARPTLAFLRDYGISFPALLDEETAGFAASNAFGISHVPTMFLVEPGGAISWCLDGFSKQDLEQLGAKVGTSPFRADEYVPEWKAG